MASYRDAFNVEFLSGSIFGFEVSGIESESIINQSVTGSDYITGGEFGFEGSLLGFDYSSNIIFR